MIVVAEEEEDGEEADGLGVVMVAMYRRGAQGGMGVSGEAAGGTGELSEWVGVSDVKDQWYTLTGVKSGELYTSAGGSGIAELRFTLRVLPQASHSLKTDFKTKKCTAIPSL